MDKSPWGDPTPPRATPRGPGECRRAPHGPDLPAELPACQGRDFTSPRQGGPATPHPTGDVTRPRPRGHPSGSPPGPLTRPSLLPRSAACSRRDRTGTVQGRALGGRAELVSRAQRAGRGPAPAQRHRWKDLVTGRHRGRGRGHRGWASCGQDPWEGQALGAGQREGPPGRAATVGSCRPVSPSSQACLSPSRKRRGPRPDSSCFWEPPPHTSQGRNVPLPRARACLPPGPTSPA